jgi:hypothetical protein
MTREPPQRHRLISSVPADGELTTPILKIATASHNAHVIDVPVEAFTVEPFAVWFVGSIWPR